MLIEAVETDNKLVTKSKAQARDETFITLAPTSSIPYKLNMISVLLMKQMQGQELISNREPIEKY